MKKYIMAAILFITVSANSFANNGGEVNQKVISSFNNEFANAREVKWDNSREFVKATFVLNEQVMFAFFSVNGNLLAVTRNINVDKLPINLVTALKKKYSNYWITDLFEIATGNETAYYVTLESADFTIVLKASDSNYWEIFSKEKN